MRSCSLSALALTFVCLCSGGFNILRAQDAPTALDIQTARCVQWMNAIQPERRGLDPVNFCSGLPTGNADGLYSVQCSQAAERPGDPAPKHCNFVGLIMPGDTLAIDVRSTSADGHEFLAATDDPANDPHRAAATFYTRTPVWIGNLRLAAGMYKLFPFQSLDGWRLAIAKQDGAWNAPLNSSQNLNQVMMNTVAMDYPAKDLNATLWLLARHCPGPELEHDIRELEFVFGSTDVSVCVRPDQVLPVVSLR